MADVIYEYHVSGTSTFAEVTTYSTPEIRCAMSFTPQEDYTLNAIRTRIKRIGTPGLVYFEIYATADNIPVGVALQTTERNGNTFSTATSGAISTTTLSTPINLTSGVTYALVLRVPNGDLNNKLYWFGDTTDDYSRGDASVYYKDVDDWGGNWSTVTDGWYPLPDTQRNWPGWNIHDFDFQTWGTSGSLPSKATTPTPANNATEVDFSGLQLSWVNGGGADTYNVYIGPTGNLTQVSSTQAGLTYTTTLAELESIFGSDPIDQKIYWRIDSTNENGTTTGDEWNFDARPAKATTPSPTNAYTDNILNQETISWVDGGGADSYDIYFGTESGNLALFGSEITDILFTIAGVSGGSPLDYYITYYWRIDSVNEFGTTTGDEWSFATIRLDPPTVTYDYGGQYYYQLLAQADGSYGDHPPTGVENVDYVVVAFQPNFINTFRRLVAATKNSIYYEEI